MQKKQPLKKELLQEIAQLRVELEDLKREKADMEILLETSTEHGDTVQTELYALNQQLETQISERQRAEAALRTSEAELKALLTLTKKEKVDLEILLETTIEHSDSVAADLQDKAVEAVRESERRLAQFLEAVPVGVFVFDAIGKPYYTNHVAQQLLGKGVVSSATTEQLAEVYQIYIAGTKQPYPTTQLPGMRALRGETTTADDMEIHQPEKIIPIEAWETPIFDDLGNIAYAIVAFQDITERKRAEVERRKFINELFQLNYAYQRFVPREFLQFLNKESIVDVTLGDFVEREMSVLFTDIRNFTTMSEKMTPEENFKFLNSYLSCMEPIINQNHGFIDKYIGDAIMALFSGDADDAVKAGIAILHELDKYNQGRKRAGYVPIKIGIGINTGSLMLGTVGGHKRMDGTVISDAVNLASRLEDLTKSYGIPLLISHHTFLRLQNPSQYAIRMIDEVQVKGKSNKVIIYEVFEAEKRSTKNAKLATIKLFEKAVLLYKMLQIKEAELLFKVCRSQTPTDRVTQIYLERCKQSTVNNQQLTVNNYH